MMKLTPATCRAARAMLDWTQGDAARAAGISAATLREFEGDRRAVGAQTVEAIIRAFEGAGVRFIEAPGVSGVLLITTSAEGGSNG